MKNNKEIIWDETSIQVYSGTHALCWVKVRVVAIIHPDTSLLGLLMNLAQEMNCTDMMDGQVRLSESSVCAADMLSMMFQSVDVNECQFYDYIQYLLY